MYICIITNNINDYSLGYPFNGTINKIVYIPRLFTFFYLSGRSSIYIFSPTFSTSIPFFDLIFSSPIPLISSNFNSFSPPDLDI